MTPSTRFLISNIRAVPALKPAPVAVMFGWVSAQDRHLQKYGDLLHSIGVPTVLRMTVATPTIFFSRKGVRAVAQSTLQSLQVSTRPRHLALKGYAVLIVYSCSAVRVPR
jgi:hypothetical protein